MNDQEMREKRAEYMRRYRAGKPGPDRAKARQEAEASVRRLWLSDDEYLELMEHYFKKCSIRDYERIFR